MSLSKNSLNSSTSSSSSSLSSSSSTSSSKRIRADILKGKDKGNGKDKASLHSFWRKRQREDRPCPDAFVDDERSQAQRRVACPACGVSMPLLKVDEHLSRHCLARSEQDSQSKCGAVENASQVAFLGQFHRAKGPELITVRAKGSREERALTNQDLERLACPFEIVPGAVAADLAADLARMLMREAKASWKPSVWTVFNNTGGTNRLSATYRFDEGTVTRERERRDAVDEDANKDADPTHVTPESTLRRLEESSEAMQNLVRERFAARCERGLARSHKGDDAYVAAWKPSFALCNYYRDGTDGIAYHSDYLTTLGPRAIVAALSLGSTRYFRWHKIESDSKQISEVYTARVPHNHAIIMWPGAQESWKHGVPTQSHESIGAHPLTQLARISLTFRMRRPLIASQAPKCKCGRPAALKYSVKASRYFFKCNPNSTQTCEFFEWFER